MGAWEVGFWVPCLGWVEICDWLLLGLVVCFDFGVEFVPIGFVSLDL